ncbi:unnamed protein product [Protopolystoma xenopodis]|uniref:Uncharacterized protein n=1 Tax=Protopolystoma xenopodis TaxID=117903 RepID=A0A448XDQ5_9PLAT|nr:unnamed protein product [Protopolystoma xenopodis]
MTSADLINRLICRYRLFQSDAEVASRFDEKVRAKVARLKQDLTPDLVSLLHAFQTQLSADGQDSLGRCLGSTISQQLHAQIAQHPIDLQSHRLHTCINRSSQSPVLRVKKSPPDEFFSSPDSGCRLEPDLLTAPKDDLLLLSKITGSGRSGDSVGADVEINIGNDSHQLAGRRSYSTDRLNAANLDVDLDIEHTDDCSVCIANSLNQVDTLLSGNVCTSGSHSDGSSIRQRIFTAPEKRPDDEE